MIKTRESTRKTERKTAKKVSMARRERRLENLNPSFTKKGPGRYHVQGKRFSVSMGLATGSCN